MKINVRNFLFAYEKVLEAIWYLYFSEKMSFKRFIIELSEACSTMVDNEERKKLDHKQLSSL
jgi:hypothetical protein